MDRALLLSLALCLARRSEEPRLERREVPTEPSPARPDPTGGCRSGDQTACLALAGSAAGCVELGLRHEPHDPTLALHLYLTACQRGELAGCANVSDPLRATEPERARRLATRACDGGDATGCNNLGAIHQDAARLDAALAAYRRSCALGLAMACGQVGALGSAGVVPMAPAEIDELLTRACEQDDARSCANLGRATIRTSPERGRAAFARACELGYPAGCFDHALSLVRGEGGPVDRAQAARVLRRSCELGYADACRTTVPLE